MILSLLAGLSIFSATEKPAVYFPIDASGEAYVGKHFPQEGNVKDTMFNIDVGIEANLDILEAYGQRLFVSYRDELISGTQEGSNVAFDPKQAHYYLKLGFRFNALDKIGAEFLINHDCTHNIDRRHDTLKVVFNRITLSAGTPGAYTNKNIGMILSDNWLDRLNGKLTWEWFPHDTVIDALNSTDIYHRLQMDASFDQPIYNNIYGTARLYSALNRVKPKPDDPDAFVPFWGYELAPQLGIGVARENTALELYLKTWLIADIGDIGFLEPDPWPYLVLHLRFK